jgi:hypothetical protein
LFEEEANNASWGRSIMNRPGWFLCLSLFFVAALAACNSRSEEPEPGEWEITRRVVEASGEGVPSEVLDQIKSERTPTKTRCLREDDVDDPASVLMASDNAGDCSEREIDWENGRISGNMSCRAQNGLRMEAEVTGDYGPEDFEAELDGEVRIPQIDNPITIRMRMEGRNVGECRRGSRDRDER